MNAPFGDNATAGKVGRSVADVPARSAAFCGADHDQLAPCWWPTRTSTLGGVVLPSAHATTIVSGPFWFGAPFAMSMLGQPFVRAPARPSIVHAASCFGPLRTSTTPGSTTLAIAWGLPNGWTPSTETAIMIDALTSLPHGMLCVGPLTARMPTGVSLISSQK